MKCPKCNREEYNTTIIRTKGMCETCFNISKGLVKAEDKLYYVPWSYRNSIDRDGTETATEPKHFEEVNISIPRISWCNIYKKWKLETSGADFGGYDVQNFEIYFDTKEDIFALMLSNE